MLIKRNAIPWLMAAGRATLGPILIAGAACGWSGFSLAAMVVTALVSDIFDGILARRWQCDTPAVRLFDSIADTVFYLCVGIALWLAHPAILRANLTLLLVLVAAEALRFTFDFIKFGKPASYHSYLAKSWGLLLAITVVSIFAFSGGPILLPLALWTGVACNLQDLWLSIMLPTWQPDIKTIPAGLRLRRRLLLDSRAESKLAPASPRIHKTPHPFYPKLLS
jgi:CDP-diacylglycerol--glycerol-3-phosphate 3-phosphatidyltransferase